MRKLLAAWCSLAMASCAPAEQPDWAETVLAVGIQTSSNKERSELIEILDSAAKQYGHHVDASTKSELEFGAQVYRLTINACVWKGQEDIETLACAMDSEERPGLVYLTFKKGSEPDQNLAFRKAIMADLRNRFGALPEIPIMPNGALPLPQDLVLKDNDYSVSADALERYERDATNKTAN